MTTMTPALVAASTSTLSRPTPARAMTLRFLAAAMRLGVHLRGGADEHGVDVGEGREQLAAVGAVDLADLEVGPEGVDGCGRELLGDQHDGLGHDGPSSGAAAGARPGRLDAGAPAGRGRVTRALARVAPARRWAGTP